MHNGVHVEIAYTLFSLHVSDIYVGKLCIQGAFGTVGPRCHVWPLLRRQFFYLPNNEDVVLTVCKKGSLRGGCCLQGVISQGHKPSTAEVSIKTCSITWWNISCALLLTKLEALQWQRNCRGVGSSGGIYLHSLP